MSSNAIDVANPARFRSIPRSGPRAGKHRLSALTQALDLRDQAYVDGTSKETPVHVKAALMRAFVDLQDLCLVLRGQGKPRPVIAKNDSQSTRKRTRAAGPIGDASPKPLSSQKDNAPAQSNVAPPAGPETASDPKPAA